MYIYKKPFISIITSSWNRENYLKKLARSLIKLKYKNFEWIIGNDGSTDNTDKFIKSYSKTAKFKIVYLNSDLRIGKSKMVNKLLDNTSGDYIVECDSDDYFLPNSLNELIKLLPKKKIKNFAGVCGQNLDTKGVSQTFKNKPPVKTKKINWVEYNNIVDGDATLMVPKYIFKNKRFLEVDFLISESSLLTKIYKNKNFILSPKIIKIMDRKAHNSVSFGSKLNYTRGSFYCMHIIETINIFNKKNFLNKIFTVINYFRYSIHGDISFINAIKMFKPFKKKKIYVYLYLIALIIVLRDKLSNKVEKTHIEFEKNKNKAKIEIKKYN